MVDAFLTTIVLFVLYVISMKIINDSIVDKNSHFKQIKQFKSAQATIAKGIKINGRKWYSRRRRIKRNVRLTT